MKPKKTKTNAVSPPTAKSLVSKSHFQASTESETDFEEAFSEEEELIINYDNAWKLIIVEFYAEFVAFFLPDLFSELDATVAPEFLDQELLVIQKELNIPKQITDKLIKIRLLDGSEQGLLLHVEIQTKFEIDFSRRMYLYHGFIFAKHGLPITALAVFTRAGTPQKYNIFQTKCFGTNLTYEYNAYRIAKQKEATLAQSDNVFALFVLAHLYVIQTTPKKYDERSLFKEKLFLLTRQRQIPEDKMERMLIFVDQIMALPISFQTTFLKTMAENQNPNPEQSLLDFQAKMKESEPFIRNFVRGGRIAQLGYEGYLKAEAEYLRIEMEKKFEAMAKAERYKAEAERQKAEIERKKVVAEKQKVKAERQKAKVEKQKAEAEKQKAEAEKQKAEAEKLDFLVRSVIALHEQGTFSEANIASILQLPLDEIAFIVNVRKQNGVMEAIALQLKQFRADSLKSN